MKPSQCHSNRRLHNWLFYRMNDRFLQDCSSYIQGELYDLGCGETPYKDYFLHYAKGYTGVDWAESYHDSKADIIADLNEKIAVEDNVADSVISISVLEHLREPQNMLNEAGRILKSGGTLMLQVPWQWMIHEAPYDFHRFSPFALTYMLEKSGFSEIEIKPQGGFFTSWFLKFNYFTRRFVKGPKFLRFLVMLILTPVWTLTQFLAPILDKLDKNPLLEASSYMVTAKKQ